MKKLLTLLCCCSMLPLLSQFNPLRSQYMSDWLSVNPAYAGDAGALRATASYRRQWMGFKGAPETFSFDLHTPLRNPHFNAGILASQDNIAVLHRTTVALVYAYRFHLPHFSFAAGVSPGVMLDRNNWNEIVTTDPGDAAFEGVMQRRVSYLAAFGLHASGDRFFLGVSSWAMFSKEFSPSMKQQPWMAYAGYRFGRTENITVTPSVLGRMIPGGEWQLDANVLVYFQGRIGAGVSYRMNDAVAGIIDVRVNEQFHFGYSYDLTVSRLEGYNAGTHEVSLRYDFSYTVHTPSPRNL